MVEWKKLGEVTSYYRGVTYNKKQEVALNSGGTKILRANNITLENNSINYDDVKEIDSSVKVRNDQWLYPEDILICAGSGSKEHVGKVAFVNTELGYAFGGFMGKIVTKQNLKSRYLFHILCGSFFKDYLKIALNSTTINNLNSEIINNFLIPIPSLEEQTQIVGILDTFTSAIDNLKEQIAQRRKQYEYYRNQLLTFDKVGEARFDVKWMKLGEVCDFQNGFAFKSTLFKTQGAPIIRITNINGNYIDEYDMKYFNVNDYNTDLEQYKVYQGDILIAMSGATTGKIGCSLKNKIYYLNQRVGKFIPHKQLDKRYLFHVLSSKTLYLYYLAGGGAQPNLSSNKLLNDFVIPIPPLEEQQRIVSVLDTFEASIQNLEAQLDQREKQYEYYRNKLLTFE